MVGFQQLPVEDSAAAAVFDREAGETWNLLVPERPMELGELLLRQAQHAVDTGTPMIPMAELLSRLAFLVEHDLCGIALTPDVAMGLHQCQQALKEDGVDVPG